MTLKEQMAIDNAVFDNTDEFGVEAVYRHDGNDVTIDVLFYKEQDMDTGRFVNVLDAKISDIPYIAVGEVFIIDGDEYTAAALEPVFEGDLRRRVRLDR